MEKAEKDRILETHLRSLDRTNTTVGGASVADVLRELIKDRDHLSSQVESLEDELLRTEQTLDRLKAVLDVSGVVVPLEVWEERGVSGV